MKKSLKEELVSVAHRILQLKEGASYEKITQEARTVYEKLAVLTYVEKLEKAQLPTIGLQKVEDALTTLNEERNNAKTAVASQSLATNQEKVIVTPINEQHKPESTPIKEAQPVHEPIPVQEPVIEKLKDTITEIPLENHNIDKLLESIEPKSDLKNDMLDIGGEYTKTAIFEPVSAQEEEKPKNLNDRLKAGFKVGLNNKLAFIKHLFDGNNADYLRVVSQLETFTTIAEAQDFITKMVKPDYNNWEGKEEYEERFMLVVSNKFE